MPLLGNLTLVVGVISFAVQMIVTAVADGNQCPDLDVFVAGLRSAMRHLRDP
jgi:hypothetical protein